MLPRHQRRVVAVPKRAVILAAGLGLRLGARTTGAPKALVRVNGVPILQNALTQFEAAGVTETTVIVGYLGEQIREAIGDEFGAMQVRYRTNAQYRVTGTAHSLRLGLQDIREDVLVLEGDVFFDCMVLKHFLDAPYRNATLLERWQPLIDGSVVELTSQSFVARWLHKSDRPTDFNAQGTYKTVNLHRLSARFLRDYVRPALMDANSASTALETVFADIVRNRGRIRGVQVKGRWVEIDDEQDLHRAEQLFTGGR